MKSNRNFSEFIDFIIDIDENEFEKKKEEFENFLINLESNETFINDVKKNYILANTNTEDLIREKEGVIKNLNNAISLITVECEKKIFLKKVVDFLISLYNKIIEDRIRTCFTIPIEICNPEAKIPEYKHDGDAGVDFYLIEDIEIPPHSTIIVKTGLKMAIPMGYELQIRPRSGTSLKTPLRIANAPGTIDNGYRDEIGILAWNTSDEKLCFKKGDRIAQGVLNEVPKMKFNIVDDINTIVGNRNGGFGSTGQ